MSLYRKKPVVIEAVPIGEIILAATHNWRGLPTWVVQAYDRQEIIFRHDRIDVKTLEGWVTGMSNDMLIRGVKGEIYPCRRDIFAATYEQTTEEPLLLDKVAPPHGS